MITKEMKILEVMERYPATRPVFEAWGLRYRVCIPCSSLFDTVEELAKKRGMSLEELLAELNKAVAEETGRQVVVVTHDPRLAEAADRVYRVEQRGEVSVATPLPKGSRFDNNLDNNVGEIR